MKMLSVAMAMFAAIASAAEPLKNGTRFAMKDVKPIRTLKLIVNATSITNDVDSICRRGESHEK